MTIEKIDKSIFMLPSNRASQSGNGVNRQMIFADKINELVEAFNSLASPSAINDINKAIQELSKRVKDLEFPIDAAITDASTAGVTVSLLNLTTLQALGSQQTSQAQTINKILAVMRTRKEINP